MHISHLNRLYAILLSECILYTIIHTFYPLCVRNKAGSLRWMRSELIEMIHKLAVTIICIYLGRQVEFITTDTTP